MFMHWTKIRIWVWSTCLFLNLEMQMLHRFKADCTNGPTFALQLLVNRARSNPEAFAKMPPLDLSSTTTWIIGAEPVQPATVESFLQIFGAWGVQKQHINPSYGMAETVLYITGHTPPDTWCTDDRHGPRLVSCGDIVRPESYASPLDLRIVNPETCVPVLDDQVGEIWYVLSVLNDHDFFAFHRCPPLNVRLFY